MLSELWVSHKEEYHLELVLIRKKLRGENDNLGLQTEAQYELVKEAKCIN